MEKYVIVTGANGYLGYYVCKELLIQGFNVIGLKHDHFASKLIDHDRIEYVVGDITKDLNTNEKLNEAVKDRKIVGILNLAALLGSSDYNSNLAVNATGVQNLMNYANKIGTNRFIQISSVVVLKKIKGPYGESKLIGEKYLTESDFDYTVFIPAMILGPESLGLNRILKNVFRMPLFIPLVGTGQQTQHPIFVEDFAKYIVKSIEKPISYRKTYEIAGDTVISFKDLIKLILKIKKRKKIFVPVAPFVAKGLGKFFQKTQKVPLFTAEHVKGVLQDSKLDTSNLKKDLNFEPTSLEQALEFSVNIIGKNWNFYLKPRDEKTEKI
jgi:nucleoside-diphosphate-sugar epimerase